MVYDSDEVRIHLFLLMFCAQVQLTNLTNQLQQSLSKLADKGETSPNRSVRTASTSASPLLKRSDTIGTMGNFGYINNFDFLNEISEFEASNLNEEQNQNFNG